MNQRILQSFSKHLCKPEYPSGFRCILSSSVPRKSIWFVGGFYSHARRVVEEFLIINKGDPVEGHSRIAIVGTLLL